MTVTISNIDLGTSPDSGTGIPVRSAFNLTNTNFSNLKAVVDTLSANVTTGNLQFGSQTIAGSIPNVDITLLPIGHGGVMVSGNLTVTGNIVGYIPTVTLKEIAAVSTDFADFQTRIAGL